jgi:hypothetical protein
MDYEFKNGIAKILNHADFLWPVKKRLQSAMPASIANTKTKALR